MLIPKPCMYISFFFNTHIYFLLHASKHQKQPYDVRVTLVLSVYFQHGISSKKPLKYTHLDIAGPAVFTYPGIPNARPLVALCKALKVFQMIYRSQTQNGSSFYLKTFYTSVQSPSQNGKAIYSLYYMGTHRPSTRRLIAESLSPH